VGSGWFMAHGTPVCGCSAICSGNSSCGALLVNERVVQQCQRLRRHRRHTAFANRLQRLRHIEHRQQRDHLTALHRQVDAAARAAYLPDLGLNVTYGIDAPQFAVNGPDRVRNLGYSASVTLDIPVWDWLSSEHKVKQSEIRRDAARAALTAAQGRQIARLDEAYSEAAAARDQLASLDASVATAAESLRLTKMRYAGGEATVLEVVDAQTAYLGAENAREDGRVRYESAKADLETITGTL